LIASAENIDFSGLSPDIIIVGGGAVGLLSAVYLASRKVRVLVLEAGPEQLDAESQSFFQAAVSSGRKHIGLHQGRFRALGGTTNFWGGQLVRFDRSVFAPRPWVSDVVWPLDLDDVEPFYRECEVLLGVPNKLDDDQKVISGLHIPREYVDDDLVYFFTRWLTEKNFRFRFGGFLASNEYVTAITNAPVTGLRLAPGSGEVAAVGIGSRSGAVEVSARHVVLASGTVELVRLLQHRTISGEAPPWVNNQWLGRGFMDHLEGTIGKVHPVDRKLFHCLFDNVFIHGMKLQPRLKLSEKRQEQERLLGAAIHVKFESQEHLENAKIFLSGLLKGRFSHPRRLPEEAWSALRLGLPMAWHYLVHRRIWSPAGGDIQLRIMLEHAPHINSTIKLTEKVDKHGMQIPVLNWAFSTEEELRTIQAAAALSKRYFESRGIAKISVPVAISEGKSELLESFVDTYHHMGGARMAGSESDGFVDPIGRVFGCKNLYIMGAATFPVSGFANPTFTALALALRTAEAIRLELQ
jgi:choline dehydrogenase-like flavoprotein